MLISLKEVKYRSKILDLVSLHLDVSSPERITKEIEKKVIVTNWLNSNQIKSKYLFSRQQRDSYIIHVIIKQLV
jgi:hypothetical protein